MQILSRELGIPMEGIGAGTKSYFWINAFISEFIAALHYDKRNHIQSFILILVCVLPLEVITYLSLILTLSRISPLFYAKNSEFSAKRTCNPPKNMVLYHIGFCFSLRATSCSYAEKELGGIFL